MKPDVAIIGAGYVGMPLAQVFAQAGKSVVLRDVKPEVVDGINRGESHIGDVPSVELKKLVDAGLIKATLEMDAAAAADAILVALPTPLSSQREPDLSIVQAAVEELAPHLRKGHLVVLESTTYPGSTPSTSRGRRASTTSTRSSSSCPERSTPTCPTSAGP